MGDFDEYDDGYVDEDEDWGALDEIERNAQEGATALLHKTVINIDDDEEEEDEDDLIIEENDSRGGRANTMMPSMTQSNRAAQGGGPGFVGRVNSKREPGPPRDGSPPPKASLFLSTMSKAWKEGCEFLSLSVSVKKKKKRAHSKECQMNECTRARRDTKRSRRPRVPSLTRCGRRRRRARGEAEEREERDEVEGDGGEVAAERGNVTD